MASIAEALALAKSAGLGVKGTTSPNPPVGAVLVSPNGEVVGVGGTQPVGGPHAEIMALREAGPLAEGATAVVTLEPCSHTGRTGPCAVALADAGVASVVYLHPDPNPQAAGGAETLAARGIAARLASVEERAAAASVEDALLPWLAAIRMGRPHVTLKFAQTLDGLTAAVDGTSQWITGPDARAHVHVDRTRRDAILIGTGTALADNPSLTARRADGSLYAAQPRRVVVGARSLEGRAAYLEELGFEQYASPSAALDALWESGARDVLVEGGAGLASSFVEEGFVDAVRAYIAPKLLGAGRGVLAEPVASTLAGALALRRTRVEELGADLVVDFTVERS